MPIHVSISEKKEEGPGLGEVQLSLCTLFFFFYVSSISDYSCQLVILSVIEYRTVFNVFFMYLLR